jgi:hypothetical protein
MKQGVLKELIYTFLLKAAECEKLERLVPKGMNNLRNI